MKITFLGTGAGIFNPLDKGYRAYTSVLVDDLLIDVHSPALHSMVRFGLDLSAVRNVAITHSHGDHYESAALRHVVLSGGVCRIAAHAAVATQIAKFLAGLGAKKLPEVVPLEPLWPVWLDDDTRLLPLPANHVPMGGGEVALNYVVERGGCRALYLVDTSIPLYVTSQALRKEGRPADVLIMDATGIMDDVHEHMSVHGSLPGVARVAECWRRLGVLKPEARVFGTHFSYEGLMKRAPPAEEVAALGVELAEDGTVVTLGQGAPKAGKPRRRAQ